MRRFISVPFVVLFCVNLFSQTGNNVYLFTLEKNSRGEIHLHSPKFLSTFNRGGYSNQPAFTPSGDLLLSVRESKDSQNDIWQFSLGTKKFRRLTNTPDFEYSPQIHPDEEHLTFLRK